MPTAFDPITGQDVDTASEAWRHSCECRWLLAAKPTRTEKHLYLYGVTDRSQLFKPSPAGRPPVLRDDLRQLWTGRPLMAFRSLEAADRILADARKIHEAQQRTA